jgi:hypothetical protein
VPTAANIVDSLLGEAIDQDRMIRELGDVLYREQTLKELAARDVFINFGFIISTSDSSVISDNLRERDIDPDSLDWSELAPSFLAMENNVIALLRQNGVKLQNQGHDGQGDLVGEGTLHLYWQGEVNNAGFDVLHGLEDGNETYNTSSGSLLSLQGSDHLYDRVDERIAGAADISFGLFDCARLKAFYTAYDSNASSDEIMDAVYSVKESFLAPQPPPGVFRKIVNGVEIFSARCPGCKRIHGNFRTYDQAAGNRQCKYCNRAYVDKMIKVSTTGNFKHLLKKKHEPKAPSPV